MAADFSEWLYAGGGGRWTLTDPHDPDAVLYLYREADGAGGVARRFGCTPACGMPRNHAERDNRRGPGDEAGRPLTDAQTEGNALMVQEITSAFWAASERAKGRTDG